MNQQNDNAARPSIAEDQRNAFVDSYVAGRRDKYPQMVPPSVVWALETVRKGDFDNALNMLQGKREAQMIRHTIEQDNLQNLEYDVYACMEAQELRNEVCQFMRQNGLDIPEKHRDMLNWHDNLINNLNALNESHLTPYEIVAALRREIETGLCEIETGIFDDRNVNVKIEAEQTRQTPPPSRPSIVPEPVEPVEQDGGR